MTRSTRRTLPLVAIGLVLALTGCFGGADATPDAVATPTMDPTVGPSASDGPAPTAEPTASATPEPTETASATALPSFDAGGELTVAPNAEADALFLERDECTNRQDGYQLEFPDDWWTNTEIARFPACVWFSPTFYEVVDETEVPDEIAIKIEWVSGDIGRHDADIVEREDVVVGGQTAGRVEWSDDSYWYVIQLGPTPEEGPNLWAMTSADMGGDYELNKAILDRMMSTIEFIGTTQ